MPRLLVLPCEGESGVPRRESASLSTWAEPAEGPIPLCAGITAVVWLALEVPLPDVADLGFCSVPDCALAPELVGALDWGLLPPAGYMCNHYTHTRQVTESIFVVFSNQHCLQIPGLQSHSKLMCALGCGLLAPAQKLY